MALGLIEKNHGVLTGHLLDESNHKSLKCPPNPLPTREDLLPFLD